MTAHVHTIFVPKGREPIDVWKELCIFGRLLEGGDQGSWVNVACDGQERAGIERAS